MEAHVTPLTPVRADRDKSWQSWCLVWVLALMLMGFGVLLGWGGWIAVSTQYHEMGWKSGGTFWVSQSGVNVYEGTDAVRVGTGLALGGLMLFIWGIAAACTGGGRGSENDVRLTAAGRVAAGISLLCLLGSAGCLMPPWHLTNLIFYGTLLLPVVILLTLEGEERRRWGGRLFVALLLTAMVCGPVVMTRIAAGIFVPLLATTHFLLLFPGLMKMERG